MLRKATMEQQTPKKKPQNRLYALTEKRPIDLSLSENPLGCSPMVSNALKQLNVELNSYPSPNSKLLRNKLALKFSLKETNFFVANGSESIINHLPRIFCNSGDEVLIPKLTFPLFSVCSELAKTKVVLANMTDSLGINLFEITKKISKHTKIIFLCNPNNPTGSVLPKKNIIQFLKKVPKNILVVVDEANIEFGGTTVVNQLDKFNNLIILRTLSKGFGLALLRIGFAIANQNIIKKLEEETPIFQISGISEQLACIALDDDEFLQKTKQATRVERLLLTKALKKLDFTVFPSKANNLFVKIPRFISAEQFTNKLEEKGVSVIMGEHFDSFDNSFFRLSIRDNKTNKLFIQKIKEIILEINESRTA